MQRHTTILVLVAVLVSLLSGCRSQSVKSDGMRRALPAEMMNVLNKSSHIVLFSLDPALPTVFAEAPSSVDAFHGHRVLGKADVRGPERDHLLRELYTGIAEAGTEVPKCFNPRHGIRAMLGDSTIELLICFECYQIQTFPKRDHVVLTARFPESTFNRTLKRAGVPIASYGNTNRPPNPFE